MFELTDAALCAPAPVASVPSLGLEPVFRRSHASLYKALAHGRIDTEQLRRLLVAARLRGLAVGVRVDAPTWDRCDAPDQPGAGLLLGVEALSRSADRVAGWSYQWMSQLDWAPGSWTAPLDAVRITGVGQPDNGHPRPGQAPGRAPARRR